MCVGRDREKISLTWERRMSGNTIFTDGASRNNGRASCKAAYGVYFPNYEPSKYNGLVRTHPSNQRAELVAIQRALELMRESNTGSGTIVTDSMYAINCLTKWWREWKALGWKTRKGSIVKHLDVIKDCLERMEDLQVQFRHVRSHLPDPGPDHPRWADWNGNRVADELAGMALQR